MKLHPNRRMLIYILLALMMPLVVLLSSTLYFAFSESYFLKDFQNAGTAGQLGLDANGMKQVVANLTGYMAGSVDSMDIQVPINGKVAPFYNDRELAHMVDVQNLMTLGKNVRNTLGVASVLLLLMLQRTGGWQSFWRGIRASSLGALGFAGVLGVLAVSDFSGAFYQFHELFFTNELWLLDPATDRLIQMLPETFFFAITARILVTAAAAVFIMGGVSLWGLRHRSTADRKDGYHADTL